MCVANGRKPIECYLPDSRRDAMRDFPIAEKLAKPGGRAIGEVGIKVIKALLRYVLAKSKAAATLREGGGKRGEFDLTLATPKLLVFVEVKAKPLIAYPTKKVATRINAITTQSFIMYAAWLSSIRVREAHGELT